MQQMKQNPQMLQQNPQVQEMQQVQQKLSQDIEARKAQLIAEHTNDYLEEEKKVLNPLDSDPLVKLKSREIDLRAEEEMRKREEAETKAKEEPVLPPVYSIIRSPFFITPLLIKIF